MTGQSQLEGMDNTKDLRVTLDANLSLALEIM